MATNRHSTGASKNVRRERALSLGPCMRTSNIREMLPKSGQRHEQSITGNPLIGALNSDQKVET